MNLIWFRNDLRIDDNPALKAAIETGEACQAIFISTPDQWLKHNVAPIKIDFIERHVNLLAKQLAQIGIPLEHLPSHDFKSQSKDLLKYCQEHDIKQVYANKEVELNECLRDKALIQQGLNIWLFESDVIVPKGSVLNGKGEMYKVFTPFKKTWVAHLITTYRAPQAIPVEVQEGIPTTKLIKINFEANKQDSNKWPLANIVTQQVLPDFLQNKLTDYHQDRDFPAIKGTSGLSPYLAIGAISPKRILAELLHYQPHALEAISQPNGSWLNELAWRDFYHHLLYHFPHLNKYQNFNSRYNALSWPNPPHLLKAWQQGKTGYPIVDAAMRQLIQTGWMHNRLRMIVASFLTKHCLIDWRLGERFFMQHLIDGDLSSNNGGWQWAAGTGCDAQPYFRIFNPITQSKKFDPDGNFIRKYLPELNGVPLKDLHFPHAYLEKIQSNNYWPAIVDHKTARQQALDFYTQI